MLDFLLQLRFALDLLQCSSLQHFAMGEWRRQ
jgi:hypothetical protein